MTRYTISIHERDKKAAALRLAANHLLDMAMRGMEKPEGGDRLGLALTELKHLAGVAFDLVVMAKEIEKAQALPEPGLIKDSVFTDGRGLVIGNRVE